LALTLVYNCLFMPFIILPLREISFFGTGIMAIVSDYILILFSIVPAGLIVIIILIFLVKKLISYLRWMKKRTNT